MKLSKKLIVGCLFVCFAAFLSSCEQIGNLIPSGKSDTNPKKEELTQKLKDATEKANQAERDFNEPNSQAKTERLKCSSMKEQSQKSGRDANNPESDTFKQCKLAKDLEDKAEPLKQAWSDAKAERDKIAQELKTLDDTTKQSQNESGGIWNLIIWLVGGLVGVLLLALLLWLAYRFFRNVIHQEREDNLRSFRRIEDKQSAQGKELNELKATVKLLSDKIDKQKNYVLEMNNRMSERGGQNFQPPPIIEEPPVYKPEPQFPVSVENYLNKVRHLGQKATADFIGGLLIQDPNRGEEFLIVKDSNLPDGLFYAVPSIDRFSKSTDFTTYYQKYYDCENPSGGTVWIKSPTTVSRAEGGWKLEEKGKLEIR